VRRFDNPVADIRLPQCVDELWHNAQVVPLGEPDERLFTGIHVVVCQYARERFSNFRGILRTWSSW
jgi:hypothetical protein